MSIGNTGDISNWSMVFRVEEVVSVHAGLTTTSEQSPLGIITKPKPKSITSEISDLGHTVYVCVFNDNCPRS